MSGSSSSSNTNNTGPLDSEYITDRDASHALRYWVPTSSKLSRGVKGIIQRVFTGEPLNNLCNVYIYNETSKSWFHEYTITGSSGEDFGRSLDGTDNADMVAIGAPGTWFGSVSNITGYARVFTKDSSGNGWTQRGASVSQTGGFGHSVALSQYDGNILVVGAPFYNTLVPLSSGGVDFRSINVSEGKVYIYKWNGTNYILQQTLNSPSGTLSTSITPLQSQSFYFGYSLGITDIGDKIIVGEPAIRNIWYVPDQLQNGPPGYWSSSEFPYTGNAHVYDNFTVLSGGTTWTSNVSMTSVIGTTGIGTSLDLNPNHVRWLDALGTSVDINRNGTRILAGGPGSYGTSNAAPHFMTGRIYTLDWDPIDTEWKEMGQVSKHIVAPRGAMLLGMNTRFDGSGRRIVSGCTGFIDNVNYAKGDILVYDWNGDQWVNFPGENVEIIDRAWNASDYWTNWQWRLGESISIDGEGEMVCFGVSEHKYPHALTSGVFRPNAFNVDNITYIGGATTSTAGSSSTVTTGSSNIWVYNIQQSMVVKGNVTVGGYVQATSISIGTEDDSSTSTKTLYFGGSKSDNSYDLTVIENRVYGNEEKAELLIFKGNDNADPTTGGGTFGPDRIRLKGGQIAFDLNAGYDRTQEDIRAVMHRNAGGAGMLGINVSAPTEVIDVDGKIKCSQGFIGSGTELTGIDLDYVVQKTTSKFNNQAGIATNHIQLGEFTVGSVTTYPTVALSGNSSSGYTVNASRDTANAYKAFNNNTSDYWEIGTSTEYSNGSNRGAYLGTTEKVSGYKGEWIELILPNQIFVTELQIYCRQALFLPRRSYTFGSNDGIEYYLIQDSGDKGYLWGSSATYNTIFTRTPNTVTEDPYNRILIIAESLSGGNSMEWNEINIIGQSVSSLNLNMKLDNTGKIGIGTTNPSGPLHIYESTGSNHAPNTGTLILDHGDSGGSSCIVFPSRINNGSDYGYIQYEDSTSSGDEKSRLIIGTQNDATDGTGNEDNIILSPSSYVGIGTSSPQHMLQVGGNVSLGSPSERLFRPTHYYYQTYSGTSGYAYHFLETNNTWVLNNNGNDKMYIRSDSDIVLDNFTGQHRSFVENVWTENINDYIGLIVCANKNTYTSASFATYKGNRAIQINESLPDVRLSNVAYDKSCFGVISSGEDPESREDTYGTITIPIPKERGDTRTFINSVGEGAIWVTNINGSLESGDYITTSNIVGYGQKQDSEFLANYTVAKITMDCDFNPKIQPVKQIKKELGNVEYWIKYKIKVISQEEYNVLPDTQRRIKTNADGNDKYYQLIYEEKTIEDPLIYEIENYVWIHESREEMINSIDENGIFIWEDHPTETEKAYKIRYLDANGMETDEANHVYKAAFVGCTYHCG